MDVAKPQGYARIHEITEPGVYVSKLTPEITAGDIQAVFEEYGHIDRVNMRAGYAIVIYRSG